VDLPGGDWMTLERSIEDLLRRFPAETVVYPGHMGVTTLGREHDTNPFLSELRVRVPRVTSASGAAAAGS
jgi:glyoxylase-like metal-dependent hydrolase (beta-lactamase superfamily II)